MSKSESKRKRHTKDESNKKTKRYEDDTCGSACLEIDDLQDILVELRMFPMRNWQQFGLSAGLSNITLGNIEENKKKVEDCFMECLDCWLRRKDNVDSKGKPSWRRLAEILEELGERMLESKIKARIRGIKEFSNEISSRDPSETPQSCISDTETFNDDNKEYTEMQQQLSQVLTLVIKTMPLADIEMQLASWLATEKINEGCYPMSLLKSYFSLSNLAALKDFVQHCRISDSARKKLNKLLLSLSLRRNRFYEKTLAKDFATEDHKMSDSINLIITFKVSWNEDEATLKDFDDFLSTDFKSNGKYIRLRVVHQRDQSPLKFECSIPSCLKEEIKECVTKKKDQLIPKGVVEVTIEREVMFNVEGGYAAVIYYEPNDNMMKFTAVRSIQLPALLKCINECCPYSEVGLIHYFHFESSDPIELIFYQKAPTGWIIKPKDTQSQQVMQADIDKFNGTDFSLHPCCPVLVCGSCTPNTEQSLYFPITLRGIKCGPVTLYIHRTLESTIPKITPYTGIVYCERKEDNVYVLGFVAAIETNFESLVDYHEDHHRIIKLVNFDFDPNSNYIIKLNLWETSSSNWIAEPQSYELSKNKFDKASHEPPSCVISICRPPDAAQSVQYSLSLEGLTDPVSIDFKLDQALHDVNSYIGLVYYEWKETEYLMTFVAGKKLSKLIQYIKSHHELAEISDVFTFSFGSPHGFIELKFDDEQCKGKGWTVQPLVFPCRLYQDIIDEATYPVPPSCLVSLYPSPDAVPTLHYSVPLVGVADPVTLFIDRKLQLENLIASTAAMQKLHESLEKEKMLPEELKLELQETKAGDWHSVVGNYIMEKNEQNEEEKKILEEKFEEQYLMETQITKELRAIVVENESYTAKLMKEREQLQERVISLERQSIKETSSIGIQFDYMIPSMDNLECLSDVQVAEKKLFLIQGDKPQLMNWERYGLRIGVQKGSLLPSETVEAAVVALVGGQFQFPPNTVLVSTVYAVSLSKPLLKRLKLEIQHCIDLTGRPGLSRYLKFAIAPVSTPSLPYQFSIVEGGEFSSNSRYGSIQRNHFCLVCIVGEKHLPNGDKSEEEEEEEQEEEDDEETDEEVEDSNSDPSSGSKNPPGANSGAQGANSGAQGEFSNEQLEEVMKPLDEEGSNNGEATASMCYTDNSSNFNAVSTGIVENMAYAGLVYYEKKEAEDLVTFTAAKDLNAMLEFIKKDCSHAERGQNIIFCFKDYDGYIELKFDAPQDEPFTGWSIKPHIKPCRFLRCDVDKFGEANYPIPPSCLISVYESPDAVPSLHYSVPLEGVTDPVTIHIQISRRTTPFTAVGTASSNDETIPVLTKRRRGGGFDIKTAKQKIKQVMIENHTDFAGLLQFSLDDVANKLFEVHMIPPEVQQSPTYDTIASSFLAIMKILDSKSDLEKHCVKYLEALSSVGGPIEFAANFLKEKWTTALEGSLQFEQSVKRVDDI